jgi:phytoene synthase
VLAAAHIYGAIGRAVAARGAGAWDRRVSTSAADKVAFILRARGEATRRMTIPPLPRPAGLWTRPQ